MPLQEHPEDFVARAERVKLRPPIEVLKRIVRAIVGAPAHEALQVTTIVEVFLVELAAAGNILREQLALQCGPPRRSHTRVDSNRGLVQPHGARRLPRERADAHEDSSYSQSHHRAGRSCDSLRRFKPLASSAR